MTRAKICGIKTLETGLFAAQAGAWALGFNFYEKSIRSITPDQAQQIILKLPHDVIKVGIFIGKDGAYIEEAITYIGLDFAQVYTDLEVSAPLKKRMILSLQATCEEDLPSAETLHSYAHVLLDAPKEASGEMGGTGRLSNWDLAAKMAKDYSVILAGGLNPSNVSQAIKQVEPYAVDVASGVEHIKGIKDHTLIEQFIKASCDEHI